MEAGAERISLSEASFRSIRMLDKAGYDVKKATALRGRFMPIMPCKIAQQKIYHTNDSNPWHAQGIWAKCQILKNVEFARKKKHSQKT